MQGRDGPSGLRAPSARTLPPPVCLDIKSEENYVAVAHNVIFSFQPSFSCFASFRQRTGGDQIIIGNRSGRDKTALEIGMDGSGGSCGLVARVNGPGARLLFAGGKKGAQAE